VWWWSEGNVFAGQWEEGRVIPYLPITFPALVLVIIPVSVSISVTISLDGSPEAFLVIFRVPDTIVFPVREGTTVHAFQGFFFLPFVGIHLGRGDEASFPTEVTGQPALFPHHDLAGIHSTITTTLWAFDHRRFLSGQVVINQGKGILPLQGNCSSPELVDFRHFVHKSFWGLEKKKSPARVNSMAGDQTGTMVPVFRQELSFPWDDESV
jgi:hypothetical protein